MDYDTLSVDSHSSFRSTVKYDLFNESFARFLFFFLEISKGILGLTCLYFVHVKFAHSSITFYLHAFTFNSLACLLLGYLLVFLAKICFQSVRVDLGKFITAFLLILSYFCCFFFSFYILYALQQESITFAEYFLTLCFVVLCLLICLLLLIPFFIFCCSRTGVSNKTLNFINEDTITRATKEVQEAFLV